MNTNATKNTLATSFYQLDRGELLEVENGCGITVSVTVGSIWITQHHDTRDTLIAAGESFHLDRPGTAVISSRHIAQVQLTAPSYTAVDSRVALLRAGARGNNRALSNRWLSSLWDPLRDPVSRMGC